MTVVRVDTPSSLRIGATTVGGLVALLVVAAGVWMSVMLPDAALERGQASSVAQPAAAVVDAGVSDGGTFQALVDRMRTVTLSAPTAPVATAAPAAIETGATATPALGPGTDDGTPAPAPIPVPLPIAAGVPGGVAPDMPDQPLVPDPLALLPLGLL